MIEFVHEIFEYKFLSNAVLACLLSSVACGIIGTYIVSRKLVFMSGGITHSSFGGIGIAYYLGYNPIWGALIFSILSAVSMEAVAHRIKMSDDSWMGILWALGMAIGIIFLSMTPGYAPNLMSFLFGNILTVSKIHINGMILLDVVLLIVMLLFYRRILYISFDRDYAETQRAPVAFITYLMLILVASTIVLTIRMVGIVLLISLLTVPPIIASCFTRSYWKIMTVSALVTMLGSFVGLYISFKTDIPSGAATILTLTFALMMVKAIVRLARSKSVRNDPL